MIYNESKTANFFYSHRLSQPNNKFRMKNKIQKVLIGCFGLLLISCYYDEVVVIPEATTPEEPIPDVISFKDNVQPLFNASCISCHKGSTDPVLEANVSYANLINGYVVKGDANASILYKALLNNDGIPLMPPDGKWSDNKINLVKGWIDQGALDN
jgi:hypothetical protein